MYISTAMVQDILDSCQGPPHIAHDLFTHVLRMAFSTKIATPPKSTKSTNSEVLVSRGANSN